MEPGGQIELTLFWQTSGPTQRPYTVFNHLVNDSGDLIAQKDNWPVDGRWPPTCWQPGTVVVDRYLIQLPSDLAQGTYYLYTGLYDARTGKRVPPEVGGDSFAIESISIQTP
jgi:hypothetical protein